MKISEIFIYLDTAAPLLLLLFFFINKNKSRGTDFIFWYVLVEASLNTIAIIYDQVFEKNNLFVYDINCILSFLLLSLFFHSILKNRIIQNSIRLCMVLFVIFFIANFHWGDGLNTFNSLTYGIASIILVVYSLLYYLNKIINPVTSNIAKSRKFWYVTGIFTYYSGSFFIFITYSYLTLLKLENIGLLWRIHNIIFFLMCFYLFIGQLCNPSPEKYKL